MSRDFYAIRPLILWHILGSHFLLIFSEAQSWRKRNMTHPCSHGRAPASAPASAHASVHESAHKSWLSLCYNPIQRLPLECSRECSRGCPCKCTRSGLVVCHLVCFHLLCSLPKFRKIRVPIKIKSAPPPPKPKIPPPLKTRNFMDMEVFRRKEQRNSRRP